LTRDQTEDRALVRRCLRNDQAAYKALLERYQRPVFALVRRMVANEEEARDLAQEAFIRAFRNLKQFDQSRKFSSWLFRIANNLCIDHYRRRKLDTVPMVRRSDGEEEETWDLPDTGPSPAETFSDRERARSLLAVVEALPPVYRMVILLRHQQGLTYDEIAETLDLPLGTVKARIHRAHKLLKEKLSRQGLDWVPGEE
jgi:RNA polymerase sigma-70 factor (ECF subfamily)